ncbi:MAG: DUF1491 family protein [Pseudomonadota bacterium]
MPDRLPTKLWIDGLIRRVQSDAAAAFVLHKGDEDRGEILIKISSLDGQARLLRPATDMDGTRIVLDMTQQGIGPDEAEIDAYILKARDRDTDLWVIEIEDPAARSFVTEPIRSGFKSF